MVKSSLTAAEREELTSDPQRQEEAHVRGAYDYLLEDTLSARYAIIGGLIEQRDCSRILDIGCTTGELRSCFSAFRRYVGVDISPTVIAAAKQRFQEDPNATFICGDIRDISGIEATNFDCVVWAGIGFGYSHKSSGSFEDIFQKIAEFLNESGTMIFECISEYSWIEEYVGRLGTVVNRLDVTHRHSKVHSGRTIFVAKKS
ncbi:class I SAM-dependent methyltransferase [Ensifer sp. IC4062]|nr:class I SAM-dependent methyltransferase [Ensifer sp. IC4062]MCA1441956.1 class I SAM-dependent methyltransferase [Ensifer sp. IC4062]